MDSPRYCAECDAWGDHHTDRHVMYVPPLRPAHTEHPYYRMLATRWYNNVHALHALSFWRVLFTREAERLTQRCRDDSATMHFIGHNPWILEYAER